MASSPRRTDPLLPIFRSRAQGRILARLFLDGSGISLRALARDIGASQSVVHKEVERLQQAGLIESDRVRNLRVLRPKRDSPLYEPLRELMLRAYGPVALLEEGLREIEGIEEAYLHGSWAARYSGEPGPEPADVDVLVVGKPDVRRVRTLARDVGRTIGRDVSPTVISPEEWKSNTPFIRTVRSRPLVQMRLGDDG